MSKILFYVFFQHFYYPPVSTFTMQMFSVITAKP
nr:MAG TPA: hypothetical protein [Caudoviricetes sp.]